jgi:transposase
MVVSEAHGLPVAFLLSPHSTHESQLALPTLAQVRIPSFGWGRPKKRIKELAMDTAFDSQELRRLLRRRGIKASAPERKRRGKRRQKGPHPKLYPVSQERWMVERVNAWHDNYRALVVRYDRKTAHYRAYVVLSAILLCLRRMLAPA